MKTMVFDLDGTLYHGTSPVPEGIRLVSQALETGMPVLFLTNNAMRTPSQIAAHMKAMGYPDLDPGLFLTSAMAAAKKKADIAVGNIVGSNIFNILFVVGSTALITPVAYSANFLVDSIVAGAAVVMLLLCVLRKQKLTRLGGVLMLVGYAGYFVYLMR